MINIFAQNIIKREPIFSRSRAAEPGRTGAPRSGQPQPPSSPLPSPPPVAVVGESPGGAVAAGRPPTRGIWAARLRRPFPAVAARGLAGWRWHEAARLLRVVAPPAVSSVEGGGGSRAAACGGCWQWRPAWLRRAGLEVLLPSCSAPASMVLAEPPSPMMFASTWCGGAGSGRRALHFWWSVEWLRESPPPYLAISLQRFAVGAGGRRGFAVAAMVVTRFPPGGPSWLGVEPLCLAISGGGRCFRLLWCAPW
jgi:hypothetical protein